MERRTEILRMTGRTEVIPLRRSMLVAAAAIFAAGCSTAQPPDQVALAPSTTRRPAGLSGPSRSRGPAGLGWSDGCPGLRDGGSGGG